jgi:DNA-binding CsgD family transcriptional regulator
VSELLDAVACCVDGERFVAPMLLPELAGMVDGTTASVQLTDKEREVLARLADGHTKSEIAAALLVSAATVKTHLNHIYGKLGARSRHEALARAVALGLLH